MIAFDYRDSPHPIRADIGSQHRAFWQRLAQPGSWWSGKERVAIAQASRGALTCRLCIARKAALSPNAVQGKHDGDGEPQCLTISQSRLRVRLASPRLFTRRPSMA